VNKTTGAITVYYTGTGGTVYEKNEGEPLFEVTNKTRTSDCRWCVNQSIRRRGVTDAMILSMKNFTTIYSPC